MSLILIFLNFTIDCDYFFLYLHCPFFLIRMLTYNPSARVTAEDALQQKYFSELPLAIDPAMFPTWPAKSEGGARKVAAASPKPPSGGRDYKQLKEDEGFHINNLTRATAVPAFSLKF